jgi:3-phenylpropionate/trans-cinnamate dioxygenase ferredoxin component
VISHDEAAGRARREEGVMAQVRRAKVADVGELAEGEARVVDVEGRTLALFNVDGRFYALDNACAHRGGPLGEGDLEGRVVVCPWHAWRWDVTTGRNANNPAVTVACYPVHMEPDGIFVELS